MIGGARIARDCRVGRAADGVLELVFEGADPAAGGRACGSGGCGACRGGNRRSAILVGSSIAPAIRAGEQVEVSVAAAGLRAIALRAFGVPLAGLLAGAALGDMIGGEVTSVVLGAAVFGGALAWLCTRGPALVGLLELEVRARSFIAEQGGGRQRADARR